MARINLDDASDLTAIARSMEQLEAGQRPVEEAKPRITVPKTATGKAIMIGLALGIVVMAALLVMVGARLLQPGVARIAVPDVKGQQEAVARTMVTQANLVVAVKYDATAKPAGIVLKVDPPAGEKLKKGGTVTLTVAGAPPKTTNASAVETPVPPTPTPRPGAQTQTPSPNDTPRPAVTDNKVAVPDVVGMVATKAREKLAGAGLVVEVQEVAGGEQPGVVQSIKPKADTLLDKGDLVVIQVSAASTPKSNLITVKDYAGMHGNAAVKDLRALGLKPEWTFVETKIQSSGHVVKTDPPAGSQLPPGSTIKLTLAK